MVAADDHVGCVVGDRRDDLGERGHDACRAACGSLDDARDAASDERIAMADQHPWPRRVRRTVECEREHAGDGSDDVDVWVVEARSARRQRERPDWLAVDAQRHGDARAITGGDHDAVHRAAELARAREVANYHCLAARGEREVRRGRDGQHGTGREQRAAVVGDDPEALVARGDARDRDAVDAEQAADSTCCDGQHVTAPGERVSNVGNQPGRHRVTICRSPTPGDPRPWGRNVRPPSPRADDRSSRGSVLRAVGLVLSDTDYAGSDYRARWLERADVDRVRSSRAARIAA